MSSESSSILLVEDDPRVASSLVQGLSEVGYTMTRTGSAEQALKQLGANRFDLVLLDLGLPGPMIIW